MPTLLSHLSALLERPLVRYILAGGLSFASEITLIFILVRAGLDSIVAVAISFWFGLALSFILQKILAFRNHERSASRLTRQAVAYGALVFFNYLFTLLFIWGLQDVIGLFIARTAALIMTTGWNYVIYSKMIFRRNNAEKE